MTNYFIAFSADFMDVTLKTSVLTMKMLIKIYPMLRAVNIVILRLFGDTF